MTEPQSISSFTTKFFIQGEKPIFQIAISYNGDVKTEDFDNYEVYKQRHNELIQAINTLSMLNEEASGEA
ncbi:MAG: hypothetical protein SFW35_02675 [Chitinophagales bacterium]|nr:hypothetical protein [Chitinophagales bacterium]